MKHALHIRPNRKQRWIDEAVLVLREQGEALSGNEIYSRTHGRVNANAMPKNARSAGILVSVSSNRKSVRATGSSTDSRSGMNEYQIQDVG